MQNKKIKQVNKNMQIPKARLWVIWLLMIVMPSIISIFGYNIFSKEYINFAKTDLIAKSYEGLKRYNQTIIPEKFLSNCLTEITSLPADKSPKQLKKDIDMLLCGETMLCLFFDKNSEKFITVQSENLNNTKNKIPPLALLRKALKKYNNIESNSDPIKQKQNEDALAIVLQQLFKTATMVPIKKDKISKNFSVFMGGELYFIYSSFTNPSKNIGGFLAVMQGRNFRFREMLQKVNNLYPYARIVFKDMNVIKTTRNPEIFHSGLKETNEGLFIVAPANESFIRHVIHGGTEQINHNYGNLLPFVECRIPIDKIYEQVNRAYSLIRLFAFILILISSIYCLNVCFFGFSDNLSFKNKIIALALIASLFPFGLFFLGTYCYDKYKDFINKMSVIQHANAELQLNSQELEQYISEIEASMEKISEKLSQDLSNEKLLPSQLLESISEAGKELPRTD